jgi:hypothetical protein
MIPFARSAAAALFLIAATPALAQGGVLHGKERPVCKQFAETGRITPKRICLTRAEWAAVREENAKRRSPFIPFMPVQLERGL